MNPRLPAAIVWMVLAAGGAAAQNFKLPPTFGEASLASGFEPDPFSVGVVAGGAVDASAIGCVGLIGEAPHFRLNYTAAGFPLSFSVTSGGDTTLAIRGPDGDWICDGDSGGLFNPLVNFPAPMSGQYFIFVGAFDRNNHDATLEISERGGAPAGNEISWLSNASNLEGETGARFAFFCPPTSEPNPATVWGADIYTDDSGICLAAVHAGVITRDGGPVAIELLDGLKAYQGTDRNGVATLSYGAWSRSYRFVDTVVGDVTPPLAPAPIGAEPNPVPIEAEPVPVPAPIDVAPIEPPEVGPVAVDVAQDLRACDDDDLSWELRREACTRLIEDGNRDPSELVWIHAARGNSYYDTRDHELALPDFTIAIEIDPSNALAYVDRGVAFLWLDRFGEAVADLDRAIELDPRTDYFYFYRGLAYAKSERSVEALADYNQVLLLDPDDRRALVARAYLHLRNGRPEQALADFTIAIEVEPFNAGIYAGRGQLLAEQGDDAAAISDLRVAELLNPNLGAPRFLLPDLIEDRTPPEGRALEFSPPADGLRIVYLTVANDEVAAVEEIEVAIMELVYFFSGRPEQPLPFSRVALLREIGSTVGNVSATTLANAFDPEGPVFDVGYDHAMFGLTEIGGDMPDGIDFTYRGAGDIWRLSPGGELDGVGEMSFICPDEPTPIGVALQCAPGLASVPVGPIEWHATFVGWEYVLVPAG